MPGVGRLLTKVYAGTAAPYEETFELTGLDAVRRRFAKGLHLAAQLNSRKSG